MNIVFSSFKFLVAMKTSCSWSLIGSFGARCEQVKRDEDKRIKCVCVCSFPLHLG